MTHTKVLDQPNTAIFDELESEVRSYCRHFTAVFTRAKGYKLYDHQGKEYIDFFAGAGALNYGHNNPEMKNKIIQYIQNDGITHSLDMMTAAKESFLKAFDQIILRPRGYDYKLLFPGPTGTNAVESALKTARKATGRSTIICFTNAFHGMTLGSLALTGNKFKRKGAAVPLSDALFMPYEHFLGEGIDTAEVLERYLDDQGSGVDLPAAVILETVQGEGGLHAASTEWLQKIEKICRERDILLIVDDIQAGCGRTGTFFSFEHAGLEPDIICLSKSLGGFGLPMAMTLLKPELDTWQPGEHNGTFRGNNISFLAATEALNYWKDEAFSRELERKAELIRASLNELAEACPELKPEVRGRGMLQGIAFHREGAAGEVSAAAFRRGLIMETSGPKDEVVKVMPPLIIDESGLRAGLKILMQSVAEVRRGLM